MTKETIVFEVKERELPKALGQSLDFKNLNVKQTQNFRNRLRYIEEVTLKIDEGLSSVSTLDEHRSFIDRLELDLSINLSIGRNPEDEVSYWLVHSTWTSEVTASEMKKALGRDILGLLAQSIPDVDLGVSKFRATLTTWNAGLKIIIDKFYLATTLAEALALYIAIDVMLANALTTIFRVRLSESVLKMKD